MDRLHIELEVRATLDAFALLLPPEDAAVVHQRGPDVANALGALAEKYGAKAVADLLEAMSKQEGGKA